MGGEGIENVKVNFSFKGFRLIKIFANEPIYPGHYQLAGFKLYSAKQNKGKKFVSDLEELNYFINIIIPCWKPYLHLAKEKT